MITNIYTRSSSYLRWSAFKPAQAYGRSFFKLVAIAHGSLTLVANANVAYLIEGQYRSESAAVLRWADPQFRTMWTSPLDILSHRDSTAPNFSS